MGEKRVERARENRLNEAFYSNKLIFCDLNENRRLFSAALKKKSQSLKGLSAMKVILPT